MNTKPFGLWVRCADVVDGKVPKHLDKSIVGAVAGVDLWFNTDQREYSLCYNKKPSPETLEHCIVDLVLPMLMAHDGGFILHCGVVHSHRGALGFMGPSGRGKSTLTASLHHRGLPLASDDAVAFYEQDDTYEIERLSPSLRLFPDSINELFSKDDETSPMADYTDKRHVAFSAGPKRAVLKCLFRLTEPSGDIKIERLSYSDACISLVENSFSLEPSDPKQAKQRFVAAAGVAKIIPIYDLSYPRNFKELHKVHAEIFKFADLTNQASPKI